MSFYFYFRASSFAFACARAITRSLRSVISSSLDLYWWGSRTQWYLV